MLFFYIVAALALLLSVVSLLQGLQSIRHIRNFRLRGSRRPRVVVFCPCRDMDPEFADNIRSIRDQDYPDFRVVFIVDSIADSAALVFQSLGVTPLIAGKAVDRGQKVHNLIYGVTHASGDADVLVFCDADARFPREWLARLIAPLERDEVGAATGYRWYAAERGSLPSILRSAWNSSVVTALGDHDKNFAWGGSMAVRRGTFDRLEILKMWEGALSDDYTLTLAVRRSGMRIVFLPECLIPSYGRCSWSDLLEFTTRQIVITRVYDPRTWVTVMIAQTLFNVAFWVGLFVPGSGTMIAGGLYLLAGLKSYLRCKAVATVLPSRAVSKSAWVYALLSPLTALLFEYNLIRSMFTRTIVWRGIRYRLISPTRTVIKSG
jgi:cellulose synthase/poly-beta-1,6-N-acetylglucosamine synthase-like glycosyltransferase